MQRHKPVEVGVQYFIGNSNDSENEAWSESYTLL
jgi:hypothetical protein